MRASRRILIAVMAMGCIAGTAVPSQAAEIGTDTAVPRWNLNPTTSKLGCGNTLGECTLTVTTVTSGSNCESEVITISSSPTPGLLYSNTQCTATLTVVFDENRVQGEACLLSFSDATLTFNSGVNSFFNGTWRRGIVANFVPTFSRENPPDWIDGGTVTVKGVGVADSTQLGTESTAAPTAKFEVNFSSALNRACTTTSTGSLRPLAPSTIHVQKSTI